MKNIKINCEKVSKAIGPYSHAIQSNGTLLFVSGQLPIDPITNEFVVGGIEEQTKQCLKNAQEILISAGYVIEDVCKTTVFLSDINNFKKMNEVYSEFMKDINPARSAFEVANLPMNALVEIELIASK